MLQQQMVRMESVQVGWSPLEEMNRETSEGISHYSAHPQAPLVVPLLGRSLPLTERILQPLAGSWEPPHPWLWLRQSCWIPFQRSFLRP